MIFTIGSEDFPSASQIAETKEDAIKEAEAENRRQKNLLNIRVAELKMQKEQLQKKLQDTERARIDQKASEAKKVTRLETQIAIQQEEMKELKQQQIEDAQKISKLQQRLTDLTTAQVLKDKATHEQLLDLHKKARPGSGLPWVISGVAFGVIPAVFGVTVSTAAVTANSSIGGLLGIGTVTMLFCLAKAVAVSRARKIFDINYPTPNLVTVPTQNSSDNVVLKPRPTSMSTIKLKLKLLDPKGVASSVPSSIVKPLILDQAPVNSMNLPVRFLPTLANGLDKAKNSQSAPSASSFDSINSLH